MTIDEIKIANTYCQQFIIKNQNYIYFCDKIKQKYVNNILKGNEIHFDSNWNYLMTLVQIIEEVYSVREVRMQTNYCIFEFNNDIRIQDKGMTKMNSIYNCCLRILNERWIVEINTLIESKVEPFDVLDLS